MPKHLFFQFLLLLKFRSLLRSYKNKKFEQLKKPLSHTLLLLTSETVHAKIVLTRPLCLRGYTPHYNSSVLLSQDSVRGTQKISRNTREKTCFTPQLE
ncbi:hypothetical protein ABKN59_004004 [Abortiporus biennis]